jgi:hypothetical protein
MSACGIKFHFGVIEFCGIVSICLIKLVLSRCMVQTWSVGSIW